MQTNRNPDAIQGLHQINRQVFARQPLPTKYEPPPASPRTLPPMQRWQTQSSRQDPWHGVDAVQPDQDKKDAQTRNTKREQSALSSMQPEMAHSNRTE